jgi:hypothetical protein
MILKSSERAFASPAITRGAYVQIVVLFFTNANCLRLTRVIPNILAFL